MKTFINSVTIGTSLNNECQLRSLGRKPAGRMQRKKEKSSGQSPKLSKI